MGAPWTTGDIPSQRGKRIIVTGANRGLGWHAALELARAGARVTLTARRQVEAEVAAARIRAQAPDAVLDTAILDLTDIGSVRAMAAAQLADPQPIDTLVNNAGVMALPRREVSIDGFERQFATNVLGPFLLTGLLLPAILRAPGPRVVTVSSMAHTMGGPTPLEDLNSERDYRPTRAYAKTKLANILFTRELQRRADGRLLAVACHPGASQTDLSAASSRPLRFVTRAMWPMMQSAARGAEPTLRAATAADATPGGFYGPGGLLGLRGPAVEAKTAPFAHDAAAAERLFDELERMTGVRYPL
jgi:NAD(P)-dependent dehydrogenase (short-subunit alcohol dehydrogenase family)